METFELDNALRKLKINTFRTYFDSGSFEYNQSGMDDKMQTMAKLLYLKLDFKTIFEQYRASYYREGYMHIHRNAIRTLIEQISFLLYGNNYQPEVVFKARKMSDDEILEWYIQVIKEKVAPQFTLQRLILAYLDHKFGNNNEKYKKLSRFFDIDFEKNIDQILYERAINENLDPVMYGYFSLNVYLKNVLFANLYDNRISDLNPRLEMPMTRSIIHFLHKHFPLEIHKRLENEPEFRAARLMQLIIDVVEVVYLGKNPAYKL